MIVFYKNQKIIFVNERGNVVMRKSIEEIVKEQIILLDKNDVKNLTGWGQNVIDYIFKNDMDFLAIKIGKKYQVELNAFKEYLRIRRQKK